MTNPIFKKNLAEEILAKITVKKHSRGGLQNTGYKIRNLAPPSLLQKKVVFKLREGETLDNSSCI